MSRPKIELQEIQKVGWIQLWNYKTQNTVSSFVFLKLWLEEVSQIKQEVKRKNMLKERDSKNW